MATIATVITRSPTNPPTTPNTTVFDPPSFAAALPFPPSPGEVLIFTTDIVGAVGDVDTGCIEAVAV